MPIKVNLRHLEAHNLHLEGQLSVAELDIETRDEVIRLRLPLEYDFEVQKLESSLLVQGSLRLPLDCQCVRCLKPFVHTLKLAGWTSLLPLQGEEAVPVVNDCVDLTPLIREDILLEFPQHPLCNPECQGLPGSFIGQPGKTHSDHAAAGPSAWAALNKLKL